MEYEEFVEIVSSPKAEDSIPFFQTASEQLPVWATVENFFFLFGMLYAVSWGAHYFMAYRKMKALKQRGAKDEAETSSKAASTEEAAEARN